MTVEKALRILFKGVKQACGHPIIGMITAEELDEAHATLREYLVPEDEVPTKELET